METRQFNVTGMSCAACSSRVEKAVCALRGVSAAEVNLLTNSLKATFDEGVLGVEDIERAVEDAGYGACASSGPLRCSHPSCGFRWGRWRACPCPSCSRGRRALR